jgi:hypothetical protein
MKVAVLKQVNILNYSLNILVHFTCLLNIAYFVGNILHDRTGYFMVHVTGNGYFYFSR